MNAELCAEIRELLVSYVDDELSVDDSARIERHVSTCEECARRIAALRDSLAAARLLWTGGEDETAQSPVKGNSGHRRIRRGWVFVGPAAAAAALLLCVNAWRPTKPGYPSSPTTNAPTERLSTLEVTERIERAGIAARLLAAADMLANQAGAADLACERYKYLVVTYPETASANEAANRLHVLCESRT